MLCIMNISAMIIVLVAVITAKKLAVAESITNVPRAYQLSENIPQCSIKRSRIAREIVMKEIIAAMEKISATTTPSSSEQYSPRYKIAMSPKCVLNVSNSMYHKLETNAKEFAQRFWRDRISGKLVAPKYANDRILTPFFQCTKVKALF